MKMTLCRNVGCAVRCAVLEMPRSLPVCPRNAPEACRWDLQPVKECANKYVAQLLLAIVFVRDCRLLVPAIRPIACRPLGRRSDGQSQWQRGKESAGRATACRATLQAAPSLSAALSAAAEYPLAREEPMVISAMYNHHALKGGPLLQAMLLRQLVMLTPDLPQQPRPAALHRLVLLGETSAN